MCSGRLEGKAVEETGDRQGGGVRTKENRKERSQSKEMGKEENRERSSLLIECIYPLIQQFRL